jgi:predicted nucleic acid-binding protein
MTGRFFIDTNIIVYAHDLDAGEKHKIAAVKLEEFWKQDNPPSISIQVLQEACAVLIKKGMQAIEINALMEDLLQWNVVINDQNILLEGIRLQRKLKISIWDSFIVAAAVKSGARHIISEDLSHMEQYEGIVVINPFLKK